MELGSRGWKWVGLGICKVGGVGSRVGGVGAVYLHDNSSGTIHLI